MAKIYHPLDRVRKEIRLLAAIDIVDDQVCCRLETVNLTDEPYYRAISWTWGEQNEKSLIHVDGKPLVVRGNAERLLRWLSAEGYKNVWLDAICINQRDLDERSHQVTLMGEIYRKSTQTLAMLDLNLESTVAKAAQMAIKDVVKQAREETNDLRDFYKTIHNESGGSQHTESPLPQVDMDAICLFFASPWFTRVWIIQEILLAKDAICCFGTVTLPWSDVLHAAEWLQHRSYWKYLPRAHPGTVGIDNCSLMMRKGLALGRKDAWFQLLSTSRMFQSTDPRDKVYGLLGLRHMHERSPPILPDYTKSPVDIYIEAARALIQEHDSLHTILDANSLDPLPGSCTDTFPSWVPRYDYWFVREANSCRSISMDLVTGAANGLKAKVHPSSDRILSVDGIVIDTIAATSTRLTSKLFRDLESFGAEMQYIWSLAEWAKEVRPQDLRRVLMNVLTINCWQAELGLPEDTLLQKFNGFLGALGLDGAVPNWDDFESCKSSIWLWSINRVFYVTDTGHIGMGPRDTAVGDVVTVLFGSRVPCVLRSKDELTYTFVGSTYAEDLMKVCDSITFGQRWVNAYPKGQYIRDLQMQGTLEERTQRFDII